MALFKLRGLARWQVDVTTHLDGLDKDLVVPTGTFRAGFDLATRRMSGDLVLPPATMMLTVGSLPLATVILAIEQTVPVTGRIDLFTMNGAVTATFNVRIVSIRPTFMSRVNLVRRDCVTLTPVVATLTGKLDLAAGSTFAGTYDLGPFSHGGLAVTRIINSIVPGPGNTISARFTPAR